MNTLTLLLRVTACIVLLVPGALHSATLLYRSGLNYDAGPAPTVPYMGINYVQLRLDQPGHLDYTVNYLGGDYFRVMLFTGVQGQITGAVQDIRWFHDLGEVRFVATSSGDLPTGDYLLTFWGQNTHWDWMDDGYAANTRMELPLDVAGHPGFEVSINGDFRPISIYEGQPDGSFRITNFVPEPGTLALAGAALLVCTRRRR